jgi:hypothetical protein
VSTPIKLGKWMGCKGSILLERIFKTKKTFRNLTKRTVQCFFHEPRLIKLVP